MVIVTGSLAYDYIMNFPGRFDDYILPDKIHVLNLSFLMDKLTKQKGGTAGNIAYNLVLLGIKTAILASAGNDFNGYKNFLKEKGVDICGIKIIEKESTAAAFIFTDKADNQIIGFHPGAMNYAKKLSLEAPIGSCGFPSFVVIAPNEPRAMINLARECRKLKIPYLFDPGMQLPRLKDQDLKIGTEGARVVIGNDYEISLISLRFRESIGQTISSRIWITTLGEKGSIIEADGRTYKIPPAKPKKVLDPTGAGDAYRAGFLAGYLRGFPLEVCGKMGSVCAVYTVEKYGTQTHKFAEKEFCQRYKENFKENLAL